MVIVKREVHEQTETDMYWDCWQCSSLPYRPDVNNVWIIVWNNINNIHTNKAHIVRVSLLSGMS